MFQFPVSFWKSGSSMLNYIFGGGTGNTSGTTSTLTLKYDFATDIAVAVTASSKVGHRSSTIQDKTASQFICGSSGNNNGAALSTSEKRVYSTDTVIGNSAWPVAVFSAASASSETIGFVFGGRTSSTACYGRSFSTETTSNYATQRAVSYLNGPVQTKFYGYLTGFSGTNVSPYQKMNFSTNVLETFAVNNLGHTADSINANGGWGMAGINYAYKFGTSSTNGTRLNFSTETEAYTGLNVGNVYGCGLNKGGSMFIMGGTTNSFVAETTSRKIEEATLTFSAGSYTYSERRGPCASSASTF